MNLVSFETNTEIQYSYSFDENPNSFLNYSYSVKRNEYQWQNIRIRFLITPIQFTPTCCKDQEKKEGDFLFVIFLPLIWNSKNKIENKNWVFRNLSFRVLLKQYAVWTNVTMTIVFWCLFC